MAIVNRILLASAFAAVTPALAQPSPAPASRPASNSSGNKAERVICEKQQLIGSRLTKKRVCKTQAEWDRDRLSAQQDVDRLQRPSTMNGNE
ncbi:MAG TPA: hypothetical protein VFP57_09050 [Sphingomicrobium sp.]|jgi:hypothetical protein|nr:hypothetical protein [Sphingomicrobium sp.]